MIRRGCATYTRNESRLHPDEAQRSISQYHEIELDGASPTIDCGGVFIYTQTSNENDGAISGELHHATNLDLLLRFSTSSNSESQFAISHELSIIPRVWNVV